MALSFKITGNTLLDDGNVINFQGLSDGVVFMESAINFPKRYTREDILEALRVTIEEAWAEGQALGVDLSDLVDSEIAIDAGRTHPLYGVTDGPTAKVITEKAISDRFERMVDASGLISRYGPVERDTWAQQIEAALKYQAGETVAFITNATDIDSGETETDLAGQILANANGFLDTFGSVVLAKRKLTNALAALPDDAAQVKAFYDTHVATWSM